MVVGGDGRGRDVLFEGMVGRFERVSCRRVEVKVVVVVVDGGGVSHDESGGKGM